jgi:hypothetical protein
MIPGILPPTTSTALAFGSAVEPVLLPGGRGTTYRAGGIILKPAGTEEHEMWVADMLATLPDNPAVRFARPVRSVSGAWVHEGYVAWTFLEGEHVRGYYQQKIMASRALHHLLRPATKPPFLDTPTNSWGAANDLALQRRDAVYDAEFGRLIDQITPHLQPLHLPDQLVHADLSGNFLVAPGLPAAIIDLSWAWAPDGYGEGIMLADVIAWEHATAEDILPFMDIPHIRQLAWRGLLSRIAEQAEHIRWFGKAKTVALATARTYQTSIDFFKKHF